MAKAKVVGVSVGADGTVWCVDSVGFAYKMEGGQWRQNPDAQQVREIAVGNASNVWCRNNKGEVFQLQASDFNSHWSKDTVAKDVETISVGADGTVWLGSQEGKLFMRTAGTWKENAHAKNAKEVTVGSAANVWCRNADGKVFNLQGSAWDGDWDKDTQASWAQSISAASDGTVWLGSADPADKDRLFERESSNKWKKNATGKAVQVSVGAAHTVYCNNADGDIYRLIGDGWVGVASPDLPNSHVIKEGETLGSIVQSVYDLSGAALNAKVDEIVALNGIENRDEIDAGDAIALP